MILDIGTTYLITLSYPVVDFTGQECNAIYGEVTSQNVEGAVDYINVTTIGSIKIHTDNIVSATKTDYQSVSGARGIIFFA